jgi:hypothetical protein
MIEPSFHFRERHCSGSDSFENVQPGALAAFRIGKLLEQPPAQRIQDSLFHPQPNILSRSGSPFFIHYGANIHPIDLNRTF